MSNGTYTKTFRIDPETGTCFEACNRPGQGEVICSIYGSQMPHTVIAKRLVDGKWKGTRFTPTEWKDVSESECGGTDGLWSEVLHLVH